MPGFLCLVPLPPVQSPRWPISMTVFRKQDGGRTEDGSELPHGHTYPKECGDLILESVHVLCFKVSDHGKRRANIKG